MINSRTKGHAYERLLVQEYRKLWFDECITSRAWDRSMDERWVDLLSTEPFYIQAKNYTNLSCGKCYDILGDMPHETNYNVLHAKIKHKWEMVIMSKEDWYEIVEILKGNGTI